MAVDIGEEALDRAGGGATLSTRVNEGNPAGISGIITSIDIWAVSSLVGCIVGTFYTTNGNTLKCRASEAIGAVASGAKRTFPGLSIAVEIGDYIGMYCTEGEIERDTTGYGGEWAAGGEHIDPGDETDYLHFAGDAISLGGYIGAAGWTGKISGVTNPAKIMGVAVANIAKVKGVA